MFACFKKKKIKVSLKGRSKIFYRNHKNEIIINCELNYSSDPNYGIVVYISELKNWDKPNKLISKDEFQDLKKNVKNEFIRSGYNVTFN